MGKVPRAPVWPFWRDSIRVRAWGKEADCRVNVRQRQPVPCYLLLEIVNMAADFSALETKGANNMSLGHPSNLGPGPAQFLWRLRHNIGHPDKYVSHV